MTISTYILDERIEAVETNNPDIILKINTLSDSLSTERFRSALAQAVIGDDDLICFVVKGGLIEMPRAHILEQVVYDLVSEEIYSFYLSVDSVAKTVISENLSLINDTTGIRAFLITRPIFNYLLSIMEEIDKTEGPVKLDSFWNVIVPSSFLIDHNPRPEVELQIHIISTFRNAEKYLAACWQSIERQCYNNYKVYFVDDCSTGGGIDLLPDDKRLVKTKNTIRKYALQNILDVLDSAQINPNDIVCFLDGDDMFSHKYILKLLNGVYQNNTTLFSYSMMRRHGEFRSRGRKYTQEEFENLRMAPWKVTHIRSFAFKLYQRYIQKDKSLTMLKDEHGDLLKMPYDMALFIPLMELAGFNGVQFIPTYMYEYRHHDANDHLLNREMQYKGELIVRAKIPFDCSANLYRSKRIKY